MKSSNEIEKALYESSNSSISITKKDGKYFNVNQFKDIEKLKEIEKKIIQYDGLAKLKVNKIAARWPAKAVAQFSTFSKIGSDRIVPR